MKVAREEGELHCAARCVLALSRLEFYEVRQGRRGGGAKSYIKKRVATAKGSGRKEWGV